MADLGRFALAAICVLALAIPAGARELGDFGRVQPGVLNDELIPAFERIFRGTGRPPSGFNLTDEEQEMRDRVWRFLVIPHARDWAVEYSVEVRPAKAGETPKNYEDRYYRWLSGERYASSRVRFNTMADHIWADVATLPEAFESICRVREIDRQRQVAFRALATGDHRMRRDLEARLIENDRVVGRFTAALAYRYDAYSYALDHLLVETPHAEAVLPDTRLSEMAPWVEWALRHDFCGHGGRAQGAGGEALPGRVLMHAPDEGPYRK